VHLTYSAYRAEGFLDTNVTVGALLRKAAAESPDVRALHATRSEESQPEDWTYAQILAESELLARRIACQHSPGARIAIWADNCAEWVMLEYAAALAGAVVVAVNPAHSEREAQYVLEQSRASALFVAEQSRGRSLLAMAQGLRDQVPALRSVVGLGGLDEFLAGPGGDLPSVSPDDPLVIQYTSGTTGRPKGAVLAHGRSAANAGLIQERARLPVNGVWLQTLPFFHVGGTVVGALGVLRTRSTMVLMQRWDPRKALELVASEGVVSISSVPTMVIDMLRHPERRSVDLSSLEHVLVGGSMVSADLVRELERELGVQVYITFGQTECGPVATMTQPDSSPEELQSTVGTAMSGQEIKIVKPEDGSTLPVGEVGEFVTRGTTMLGYFDDEEATTAAFDSDGWLHTGDLCRMDSRGYVTVVGRLKDMVIRGGENIYPQEIESQLLTVRGIFDAAVVGVPDDRLGETLAAFVVTEGGADLDVDVAMRQLRANFASFKIPQHWVVVEALPKTPSGKVQKFVLRERWRDGTAGAKNGGANS
jgi:fatty-acyl-CoA synthase